jgi:hypothetical protein
VSGTALKGGRYNLRVASCYTGEVLDELRRHGVAPRPDTDPALVRHFLSDLYRFEIRRLKGRLARKEFPMPEYADRVRELRRRYVLLSIPVQLWTRPKDERPA